MIGLVLLTMTVILIGVVVIDSRWLVQARFKAAVRAAKQIATVFAIVLFGSRAASAEVCAMTTSPRYNLVSDTVTWSMKSENGHRCLRGVRYANVEFERVTLISPPRSGQVVFKGWGFSYTPKDDFRGEDSFDVEVSGRIRKLRGTSTIHVFVSVVEAELSQLP